MASAELSDASASKPGESSPRVSSASTNRYRSLDGLRGVAALVVLLDHALATIPAIGDTFFGRVPPPELAWLVRTPVHSLWAGQEAVLVFFVLSGVVLALPAMRRPYRWRAYYPSRLVRLYLPVIASVVLASSLVLLVPRSDLHNHGMWMAEHEMNLSVVQAVRNMTLIAPNWLNSPLWSLRWEMIFSVLLPVFLAVGRGTLWQRGTTATVAAIAIVTGEVVGIEALKYLPVFLIGTALVPLLHAAASRRTILWSAITLCGLLGISATWWLPLPGAVGHGVSSLVVLVSAVVIVISATACGWFRRWLEKPVTARLGQLSFSLYLVHEPIVVSVGALLPASAAWLTLVIAVPLSLVVAAIFFALVEKPAHVLARRVNRRLSDGLRSAPNRDVSER